MSRWFRGECNGCENECQGVAPESSRQAVPILDVAFPKRSWRKHLYSTFVIAIIVTFYYSATPASVYASSTRRVVCIIRGILALYSSETIYKGPKFSWGAFPQTLLVGTLCAHLYTSRNTGNPPCEFLPTPVRAIIFINF